MSLTNGFYEFLVKFSIIVYFRTLLSSIYFRVIHRLFPYLNTFFGVLFSGYLLKINVTTRIVIFLSSTFSYEIAVAAIEYRKDSFRTIFFYNRIID